MIYPKIPLAQSILEICLQKGVHTIVISPGSRNAPLTIGFVNNPKFKCYSIADERCAAFFALGMAQQSKQAVALVCTSGSALLNYYPAVAEAFYSQIPLVVIAADRPQTKIDIGDGQTIRQENVYSNHSLYNANLTEDVSEKNDLEIAKAITIALTQKGPVHINAPFEEPLYETTNELLVNPKITQINQELPLLPIDLLKKQAAIWNKTAKKLILVGVLDPFSIPIEIIENWAKDPSVIVMTETTSNLHHPSFISNIDTIITPFGSDDFETFKPDLLITFGGMVVSKRIKAFLRKNKPLQHWHIDSLRAYDTYNALTDHFEVSPEVFFTPFLPLTQFVQSAYKAKMETVIAIRTQKTAQYLEKIPFCDFKVFDTVLTHLPPNTHLQISNSSAIRYAQLIAIDPSIEVYCNRGTSGIDGSTSTAIGAAVAQTKQTTLITGDIGFLYDSNALWNTYIPKNFKIILINNGGGGIFRILPGHQETAVFNTYFETSHQLTAQHLATMYGLNYFTANNQEETINSLKLLLNQNENPAILEIFTPTLQNNAVLLQFFKELT